MISRGLGLSVILHGMIILLFVAVPPVLHAPVKAKDVIEFEVQLPSSTVQNITVAHAKSKISSSRKSHGKEVSLQGMNLFGQSYTYDSSAKKKAFQGGDEQSDFKDSANYSLGSDSFLGENNQWEFYRQVFERIDSHLLFDSLLAQYNHFGNVFIEFAVDAEGHFVEKRLKISSQDPILKVHAMRALRKALFETFERGKWNPSGQVSILQAKFEFLQGDDIINAQKQKQFGKPVFVFKRATLEKPVSNDLAETLINAETIANPYLIGERLEKYNKKKRLRAGEFDPFQQYRSDPDYNL